MTAIEIALTMLAFGLVAGVAVLRNRPSAGSVVLAARLDAQAAELRRLADAA